MQLCEDSDITTANDDTNESENSGNILFFVDKTMVSVGRE